ncbi:glycosyltransferase [Acrocarpospora sp. B8E8]|uniref:glycosyltransferase n=1 Tax=Acrocarpospora sp. B8E8 TaxID=3153572 RepID=UPI00325DC916
MKAGQPRVRFNDYGIITPPALGRWRPSRTVSVVIPAWRCQEKLDLTLAALAGQSYPAELMEVVVVDDGNTPPLRLPEIVPARTRLIQSRPGGWGRAWACQSGADAADGEIVHWLDADMIPFREHVEAQLRWHHLADYLVVMGALRFAPERLPTAQEVHAAVSGGYADKLFEWDLTQRNDWFEDFIERTDGLRDCPVDAYNVHVGATATVSAELLRAAGGMDTSLVLGEDTDLGWRLSQQGAVFIPDAAARSWHLGPDTVARREKEVKRYNWPHLAERIPELRWLRTHPRRTRLVPYVDVVVDVAGLPFEDVRATVDGVLAGVPHDVTVTLVGPWRELTPDRRSPLDDPLLDLRLARASYENESRVRFTEVAAEVSAPAMFRLRLPGGWVPAPDTLQRLTAHADTDFAGVLNVVLSGHADLVFARLERTAAISRGLRLVGRDEDLDDVVHATFGVRWTDGAMWGFVPAAEAAPPRANADAAKWEREAAKWRAEAVKWKATAAAQKQESAKWKAESNEWRRSAVQFRRELGRLRLRERRWRRAMLARAPFLRAVKRALLP